MTRDFREDPRIGDMIAARSGYRVSRRIIDVRGGYVLTTGMAGGQRNRWMKKAGLRRYDLMQAAEDDPCGRPAQ